MEASQADSEQGTQDEGQEGADEHVVQGKGPHDEDKRNEQQPQELGHSSAPPPEAQSGVGASGIPEHPGAQGESDANAGRGDEADGDGDGDEGGGE